MLWLQGSLRLGYGLRLMREPIVLCQRRIPSENSGGYESGWNCCRLRGVVLLAYLLVCFDDEPVPAATPLPDINRSTSSGSEGNLALILTSPFSVTR